MSRASSIAALAAVMLALPAGALAMNGRTGGDDPAQPAAPINYLRDAKYLAKSSPSTELTCAAQRASKHARRR
jgi:hypothetical protein